MTAFLTSVSGLVAYFCLAFLVIMVTYLVAVILFSKSDLNTFYIALPVNRFAFVERGGKITRIIYNSETMKLIADKECPLGKFVPIGEPGEELQKLGSVEKMLGVRLIGIPFIHTLLGKKTSWISVKGSSFVERKDILIYTFAITKTFGFRLKELTLGRDSDKETSKDKTKGDDQKLERILVDILMMLQGVIYDPHLAIIATDWVDGVEGKLQRFVQAFLGHTSQDELIEQKAPQKDDRGVITSPYCPLVQELLNNIDEIQTYGVTFEPKKITYVRYELAGEADAIRAIRAANTKRFEKGQEAAGIKAIKSANQEDMREQQEIIRQTVKDLVADGMSMEQAKEIALSMLRQKGLSETNLTTLFEAGASANVSANVSTENKRKEGAK